MRQESWFAWACKMYMVSGSGVIICMLVDTPVVGRLG